MKHHFYANLLDHYQITLCFSGNRGRMVRGPPPPQNMYNPLGQQQTRELVSVPLNDHSGPMMGHHPGSGMGFKRPMHQDNNQNYPMHGEVGVNFKNSV